MYEINQLFFELIQVALGVRVCLSHSPIAEEWKTLYDMAKKQSLIGICFVGVQRLSGIEDSIKHNPYTISLPEVLYLTWMGMAAKIQQRNEVVNRLCEELQAKLSADGFRSCILKGQGVAGIYGSLSSFRQSGDIDVWVQNKSIPALVEYVKEFGVGYKATAAHVECELFPDTDVELHAVPAFMRNFRTNRKLVQWFNESKGSIVESELGFNVLTFEFNLVYMVVHMYHHVLFEGLGLRQLMDYYFVLCTSYDDDTFHYDNDNFISTTKSLDMFKFASGIMWIMKEVFALEDRYLLCDANEKYGRLILEDVMQGGNFGHHDEKNRGLHSDSTVGRSLSGLKRNMKFFALGPWEILSSPLWSTWHWCWRKRRGLL